jgi:hypothetical protein
MDAIVAHARNFVPVCVSGGCGRRRTEEGEGLTWVTSVLLRLVRAH